MSGRRFGRKRFSLAVRCESEMRLRQWITNQSMVDITDEDIRRLAAPRMCAHCVCVVASTILYVVHCRNPTMTNCRALVGSLSRERVCKLCGGVGTKTFQALVGGQSPFANHTPCMATARVAEAEASSHATLCRGSVRDTRRRLGSFGSATASREAVKTLSSPVRLLSQT